MQRKKNFNRLKLQRIAHIYIYGTNHVNRITITARICVDRLRRMRSQNVRLGTGFQKPCGTFRKFKMADLIWRLKAGENLRKRQKNVAQINIRNESHLFWTQTVTQRCLFEADGVGWNNPKWRIQDGGLNRIKYVDF